VSMQGGKDSAAVLRRPRGGQIQDYYFFREKGEIVLDLTGM